jgi:hypothetical protein
VTWHGEATGGQQRPDLVDGSGDRGAVHAVEDGSGLFSGHPCVSQLADQGAESTLLEAVEMRWDKAVRPRYCATTTADPHGPLHVTAEA